MQAEDATKNDTTARGARTPTVTPAGTKANVIINCDVERLNTQPISGLP